MYIIDVNVGENREVFLSNKNAGISSENNVTLLNFTIPEKYSDYYKYLDIVKGDNEKTQTVVSAEDEYKFSYKLPYELTQDLKLYLQLIFKKNNEIFKTNIFYIVFNPSVCATQYLQNEYQDTIEYIMENKADLSNIDELKNKKLDKDIFYNFSDSQNVINSTKVDKTEGKDLSSNDYTDAEKNKLLNLPSRSEWDENMNLKADAASVYDRETADFKLSKKVDKEDGKELSSNDYTDAEKNKLLNLPNRSDWDEDMNLKADAASVYDRETADFKLSKKVDKEDGKGLSSNDYTDAEKTKLNALPQNSDFDRMLNSKQDKADNSFNTESKTVSGAINELKDSIDNKIATGYTTEEKEKLAELPYKNELNENFSNSLKEEKSGSSITLTDMSPIEHELDISLTSDTITDFSNVTVTRFGKNIIPYPYINTTKESNGVTYTDNGDGTITVSGNATAYSDFILYEGVPLMKNGYITFSAGKNHTNIAAVLGLYDNSDALISQFQVSNAYNDFVKIINLSDYPETVKWRISVKRNNNGEVSGTMYPQIEIGENESEYEKYVEPISFNVEADGKVKGIASLYPATSFITDNKNVTINCKYNKDINKAFAELQQAINSLGGNI